MYIYYVYIYIYTCIMCIYIYTYEVSYSLQPIDAEPVIVVFLMLGSSWTQDSMLSASIYIYIMQPVEFVGYALL